MTAEEPAAPPAARARALRAGRGSGPDAVLLAGLVLLALAVAVGWWPVPLDHAVERALPPRGAGGTAVLVRHSARHVVELAEPVRTAALTVAVAAVVAVARRRAAPLRFAGVRVLALLVTVLGGKALLRRPGPLQPHVTGVHGYFPSGHTATALVCTATVAALLGGRSPHRRRLLHAAAAAWTALVAAALVVHRSHWLTDVIGAGLLGLLIVRRTPPYDLDLDLDHDHDLDLDDGR